MQIAQPPQERMEGGLQRRARVAPARLLSAAALQVGSGAERPARAGDDETADLGLPVVDRVERRPEAAEHVDRHRVHDFLMVELQDGNRSVEVERDVLELHCFLSCCGAAYFVSRDNGLASRRIFDFLYRLVHARRATT